MYENANNNKDLKLDNHLFEEKYKMKGVKLLFIKNQAQNCQMPMSVGYFFGGGGGGAICWNVDGSRREGRRLKWMVHIM